MSEKDDSIVSSVVVVFGIIVLWIVIHALGAQIVDLRHRIERLESQQTTGASR